MPLSRRERIRKRANRYCEYCLVPDDLDPRPFHIDHIQPLSHGGSSDDQNLAWSCADYNLTKGPNLAGIDSESGSLHPLFHPRRDSWSAIFEFENLIIIGRTPVGRATIAVLNLNSELRLRYRELLSQLGQFPPSP